MSRGMAVGVIVRLGDPHSASLVALARSLLLFVWAVALASAVAMTATNLVWVAIANRVITAGTKVCDSVAVIDGVCVLLAVCVIVGERVLLGVKVLLGVGVLVRV